MPDFTEDVPEIGVPAGVKERHGRVDFKPELFDIAVDSKGYRLAWTRAAHCPCSPVNTQTQQPDPTCALCSGTGWLLFRPSSVVVNKDIVGELDALQTVIVGANAVVIFGVMTGLSEKYIAYDPVTARSEGMAQLTVRGGNKLGYYDRLTNLDATVVYSQIVTVTDPTKPLKLRYPIRSLNLLRSSSKVFDTTDLDVTSGDIVWLPGKAPAKDTRLGAHFLCHPTWRVVDHPHSVRVTSIKRKTTLPAGAPQELPINAIVKYEWML